MSALGPILARLKDHLGAIDHQILRAATTNPRVLGPHFTWLKALLRALAALWHWFEATPLIINKSPAGAWQVGFPGAERFVPPAREWAVDLVLYALALDGNHIPVNGVDYRTVGMAVDRAVGFLKTEVPELRKHVPHVKPRRRRGKPFFVAFAPLLEERQKLAPIKSNVAADYVVVRREGKHAVVSVVQPDPAVSQAERAVLH